MTDRSINKKNPGHNTKTAITHSENKYYFQENINSWMQFSDKEFKT